MNRVIRVGAGKGKLLGVLNEWLSSLGLNPIDKGSRNLIHYRHYDDCTLKICLLRWEDIKTYANEFDMIIFGSDQWLETSKKNMIALRYFEQKDCRLSLLVPKENADMPLSYFKQHKIATGYPNLARDYIGVDENLLIKMTGSVEASVGMGWAESIFDIIESGTTAREMGLVEYKTFIRFGAVLATTKPELIPVFRDLKLIPQLSTKHMIVAFDGVDGSGKSTLAKHFVQSGLKNNAPTVLVSPYSGYIGVMSKSLLDSGYPYDWAVTIGRNHWKAPDAVNGIYDRSIVTFITELLKADVDDKKIVEAIENWSPLPDILFYCDAPVNSLVKRTKTRGINDEFDTENSLKLYHELYAKAFKFVEDTTGIRVVYLDTDRDVNEVITDVNDAINVAMEGLR